MLNDALKCQSCLQCSHTMQCTVLASQICENTHTCYLCTVLSQKSYLMSFMWHCHTSHCVVLPSCYCDSLSVDHVESFLFSFPISCLTDNVEFNSEEATGQNGKSQFYSWIFWTWHFIALWIEAESAVTWGAHYLVEYYFTAEQTVFQSLLWRLIFKSKINNLMVMVSTV